MYLGRVYHTEVQALEYGVESPLVFAKITSTDYALISGSTLPSPTTVSFTTTSGVLTPISIAETSVSVSHPVSLWAEPKYVNYLVEGTSSTITFDWPCVATSVTSPTFTIVSNEDQLVPIGVILDDTVPTLKIDPAPSVLSSTVVTFKLRMTWNTTWITEKPFYITIEPCIVSNCILCSQANQNI